MAWDDIPDYSGQVAEEILSIVKEKDIFTYLHCCRVGRGSRKLAKAMGLNDFEQAVLEFAGLFHDIGKIRVPRKILVKPGRLERHEIEIMKTHPQLSAEMIQHLDKVPFFRFQLPGIKYHHEKVEGSGYPFNMRGEAIPLFARVIAVVDAYDAMTHARPYRKPLSEDKAIQELKDFSGRQFDERIVRQFLDYLPHFKSEVEQIEQDDIIVTKLIRAA